MPSKTKKQANFMRACASEKGRKAMMTECPPRSVAKKFAKADATGGHGKKTVKPKPRAKPKPKPKPKNKPYPKY